MRLIRETIGYTLCLFADIFCRKPFIISLYFHDPSPKVFEDVIKWCISHKYRFLDLDELYHIMIDRRRPVVERVAFISFDDGWRSNLELLPIIEKYKVPITIFVTTEPVVSGNYWWEYARAAYSRKDVERMKKLPYNIFRDKVSSLVKTRRLQRSSIDETELKILVLHPLVSIQSHTVTHPILINCDDETLERELRNSKKYLEDVSHNEIMAFSYPNGDVGEREVSAVKRAGYKLAFTTKAEKVVVGHTNILMIPRMAMNTYGGKYENISKILGLWQMLLK